mmetsp:Transcript_13719/g.20714  ORF Transcript_13719/g.20714 Transcript_13719/m.20714 type:complete len:518 (+) Transcript_13719:143-1696(+)
MHMETEPAEDYKRANFSDSDEELPTLASATDKRETKDHLSIIPRTPTDRNPEVATFEELLHKRQPKTLEDILDLRFVFNKITEEKEEEDEGIGAAGYELTKHRHGVINRVLRLGQAHDANRLLSFKKSLIKKSLLKMNRPRDEQCVQMFKNIMSFMGDRHSSKDPAGHARKLVRNALKAPVGMRDELYLQICKQIRGHPNAAHCVEGWNLLLVCLYSFPPSRNIKVKQFLNAALQESKSTKEMKDRAKFALKLLPLIEKLGDRKEMPPDIEVEAVRQLKKVDVHIFMAAEATNKNEPSFHIKVDPFTTVEEAEQMCYRKLEIKFTEAFGLFEANDDAESPLVSSERLLDAVSSWDRSIDEDEDIQDVKKKKSKAKIDAAEEEHKPPEYRYLLFQAKLCLRTGGEHKVEDLIADPKAITLLYCQAKRDVIQCRIQNEETKDIENLAALKLQADEGDYMPDIHRQGFIIPKLHEYVPLKLLPKKKEGTTNEAKLRMFEQTIMDKYKKVLTYFIGKLSKE